MAFQPFGDRLIVRCAPTPEKTEGGIIIPEESKEPPGRGTVLAVGEGTLCADGTIAPLAVKVGQEVVFQPFAGTVMELEGEGEVRLLNMRDLMGVNLP